MVRRAHLLDLQPDLGTTRPELAGKLTLPVRRLTRGAWRPAAPDPETLGLLVVEGLLLRRTRLDAREFVEPVGPGCIVRPVAAAGVRWEALQNTTIATFDPQATRVLASDVRLLVAVTERMQRRPQCLAQLMAATQAVSAEQRLLAVLGHLADLWGRPHPGGTLVPFRLTHSQLAGVIGVHRPTVSSALAALDRDGRVRRLPDRRLVLCA